MDGASGSLRCGFAGMTVVVMMITLIEFHDFAKPVTKRTSVRNDISKLFDDNPTSNQNRSTNSKHVTRNKTIDHYDNANANVLNLNKIEPLKVSVDFVQPWIKKCVKTSSANMFKGLEPDVDEFVDDMAFPADAAEHFLEVLEKTKPYRKWPV